MIRLLSFAAVLLLSACQHAYTAESWEAEMLGHYKKEVRAAQQAGQETTALHKLFLYPPAAHAAAEAAAGRYALYSIAMGYGAEEKDAQLYGVDCGAAAVETIPLVFGCMPPGAVFFKRMYEYNAAMLAQPGFPHAAACRVAASFEAGKLEWFTHEVESANAEKAAQIKKWRGAERRPYNP